MDTNLLPAARAVCELAIAASEAVHSTVLLPSDLRVHLEASGKTWISDEFDGRGALDELQNHDGALTVLVPSIAARALLTDSVIAYGPMGETSKMIDGLDVRNVATILEEARDAVAKAVPS